MKNTRPVNTEALSTRNGAIKDNLQTWQFPDFTSISKDTIVENYTDFCDDFRKGFGKEILLDGIYFWYGHFSVGSSEPILINTAASHVQMNFVFKIVPAIILKHPPNRSPNLILTSTI
jgi:hypothetical protein